jgi:hypothetical protein
VRITARRRTRAWSLGAAYTTIGADFTSIAVGYNYALAR